jgi:hypothetical protein
VSAVRAQSASATTTPFARIGADELFVGDCREVVPLVVQPESIDAIVTDPPYDLKTGSGRGFMGKAWDGTGVAFDVRTWEVAFDALKPGGHLVAFGGTRTAHRMTCAIEDAGFEIRDTLAWLYGSGFPKSLDVSKAIDRVVPRLEMFRPFAAHYAERRRAEGLTHSQICAAGEFFGEHNHGGASVNWERGHNVPTPAQWAVLQPLLGLSDEWASLIERVEAEREHLGTSVGTARPGIPTLGGRTTRREFAITGAATDAARQWEGWGTALKPCHEPIILARKPLSGTVAANVLEHGTGALNIDGCRVGVGDEVTARPPLSTREHEGYRRPWNDDLAARAACEKRRDAAHDRRQQLGRWPGNVVLGCACEEEHEPGCAVRLLDEQSGTRTSGKAHVLRRGATTGRGMGYGSSAAGDATGALYGDTGGASRFFYAAKASRSERTHGGCVNNPHPTVKPLALIRWLCRLITPAGGRVLDPFAGSGTTWPACMAEGFSFTGVELLPEHAEIIYGRAREHAGPLFAAAGGGA